LHDRQEVPHESTLPFEAHWLPHRWYAGAHAVSWHVPLPQTVAAFGYSTVQSVAAGPQALVESATHVAPLRW
jgi:hypothetical protein